VILKYTTLTERRRVVPDATVTSPTRKVRLFLLRDPSRMKRKGVRKLYERYSDYLGVDGPLDRGFDDGCEPWLVMLVRTPERAAGLAEQLRYVMFRRMGWAVVLKKDAVQWIGRMLIDAPTDSRAHEGIPNLHREECANGR
jgi:hypothetical protein